MLSPLVLTPVHGDDGKVQGACVGRGGESTLQERGWPSSSPAASPLLPT